MCYVKVQADPIIRVITSGYSRLSPPSYPPEVYRRSIIVKHEPQLTLRPPFIIFVLIWCSNFGHARLRVNQALPPVLSSVSCDSDLALTCTSRSTLTHAYSMHGPAVNQPSSPRPFFRRLHRQLIRTAKEFLRAMSRTREIGDVTEGFGGNL